MHSGTVMESRNKLAGIVFFGLVGMQLSGAVSAEEDETLMARDSCAAVAASIVSASSRANSVASLRQRTKAAYLNLARGKGIEVLPMHAIEEPIDIILDTYAGTILDQVRGGMFSGNAEQFVQGIGYSMAFTSATCMAILLK